MSWRALAMTMESRPSSKAVPERMTRGGGEVGVGFDPKRAPAVLSGGDHLPVYTQPVSSSAFLWIARSSTFSSRSNAS
jgi:hypothetical protein